MTLFLESLKKYLKTSKQIKDRRFDRVVRQFHAPLCLRCYDHIKRTELLTKVNYITTLDIDGGKAWCPCCEDSATLTLRIFHPWYNPSTSDEESSDEECQFESTFSSFEE